MLNILLAVLLFASASYQLTPVTYQHQNVVISYPQLTGPVEEQKLQMMNHILEQDALQAERFYEPIDRDLTLEMKYTVKRQNRFLSVAHAGTGYVKGAAHPNNLFLTTNFDTESGKRLRLSDIVILNTDFVRMFKEKAKGPSADYPNILQQISDAELLQRLKRADVPPDRECDVFSYLTPAALGISIGVPHVLGDHAEFEVPYAEIQPYLQLPVSQ